MGKQLEKPFFVSGILRAFKVKTFGFQNAEAERAFARLLKAREKVGIHPRPLPSLQMPILTNGDTVPPPDGLRPVEIPSGFFLEPVELLAIDAFQKAALQWRSVLAIQQPVRIENVDIQRLGQFPIQFFIPT